MKKASVALGMIFFCLQAKSQQPPVHKFEVVPFKSNQAADAVGVNTHLNYANTVYYTHYADIIKPRLAELGIKHIRDHFGDSVVNNRYAELAHKFDIKLLALNNDGGNDLAAVRDEVIRLNAINPEKPVVEMIEAANERDNGWKQDWDRLCTYLKNFNKIFKADINTASLPLVGASFANTRNSAVEFGKFCVDAQATMDLGNLHAYSGLFPESPFAGGWGISFPQAVKNYRAIAGNKPIIETESGYKMSEGIDGHPAVSQHTAAKYVPRLVLERLRAGVKKVYFYQLINNDEDFGLLNKDGSPRPQFTSLKNFISIMADSSADYKTQKISYTLSGNLDNISQMMFQKSDGRYLLVIWQGINGSVRGMHNNDYSDVNNANRKLNFILNKKASAIKIYRPSFEKMPDGNGGQPTTILYNVATVPLEVPDHILILEIRFAGSHTFDR